MKKTIAVAAAAMMAAGGLTAFPVASASAAPAPTIGCRVIKTAGKFFAVVGEEWPANTKITIRNSQGVEVDKGMTLPDGKFEFTGLPNGNYTARTTFAKADCARVPSKTGICRVIKGAGKFYAVVGQEWPANTTITIRNSKGRFVAKVKTLPDGKFERTGLPNGNYTAKSKFGKATCPRFSQHNR